MPSFVPALQQWYTWDGEACVFEDGIRYFPREMQALSVHRESDSDLLFIHQAKSILNGEVLLPNSHPESPFTRKLTVAQVKKWDATRIERQSIMERQKPFNENAPHCKECGNIDKFRVTQSNWTTRAGMKGKHYGIYCGACNTWQKWVNKRTLPDLEKSSHYLLEYPRLTCEQLSMFRVTGSPQCTCGPSGYEDTCPVHGDPTVSGGSAT